MKLIIKIRFVVLHGSHVPVPTQTLVMRADWAYHGRELGVLLDWRVIFYFNFYCGQLRMEVGLFRRH